MNNLNTHFEKSLTDRFGIAQGRKLWVRFTVHYTAKHGSWLNPAAATSVLPLLVARAKESRPADAPEWITVGDAAELSGTSCFFFYNHWKELPFCRKIGRSVKLNRRGLRQWLETKKAT